MAKGKKQEIERYLSDEFNIGIYEDLTESEEWKGLFEPLEFFNLLYSEFKFFQTNVDNYLQIKNHFGNLALEKEKKYYFLWAINELLDKYFPSDNDENMEGVRFASLVYLSELKMKIENELFPKEDNQVSEKKFDFEAVKKHLETITETKNKIKYLIEIETDFTQIHGTPILGYGENSFADLCKLEIKKLEKLLKLETASPGNTKATILQSCFTLSEAFSKIDYIRIVNALSELRCFKNENGTYPTKKEVMQAFGDLVNIDLSDHSNAINKAFNSNVSLEKNIDIFKKMEAKTQTLYLNNQNKGIK